MLLRGRIGLVLLLVVITTLSAHAQQRGRSLAPKSRELDADATFDLISATGPLAVLGTGWKDDLTPQQRWTKTLREQGLVRTAEEPETWSLQDATGKLTAMLFLLPNKATFVFSFAPGDHTPVPQPLITRFLTDAVATSLHANQIELTFAEHPVSPNSMLSPCQGTVQDGLTLELTGGVLVGQTRTLDCKR